MQQTGAAGGNPTGDTVFLNVALITRNPTGWQILASTATGDPFSTGISSTIPVQSGTAQRLLVLPPGENKLEGNTSAGGKQGSPSNPFTAGTTYYVQVLAVDSYYNIVTTTNPVVTLTSNDPFVASPSTASPNGMTSGVLTLPFMLKTAEVYPNGTQTTTLTGGRARLYPWRALSV